MDGLFVDQLKRLCREHPTRAKWVFAPTHAAGRTLGDRLALEGTDWANLRFVTPLEIALRMGAPFLVERGIDPSEEGLGPALMMRLLLQLPAEASYFKPLADQPQMAMALWATLRELRMAGLHATDLRADAFASKDKHAELCALLESYEAFLDNADEKRGDRATVFHEALAHLDWCPIQPRDCRIELPDVIWSPLERRLLDALPGERIPVAPTLVPGVSRPRRLRQGPQNPEPTNPEPGTRNPEPSVSLFQAGGLEAEIEEVFRRILTSGSALDTVEIACASDRYSTLIWEKAVRYDWPVTLAAGIPATLTRPGRALLGYAEWIEDDFAAGRLRRLLQSGDVTLGDASTLSPGRASRFLVKAQAAWGRDTYRRALGRMAKSERTRAMRDDVSDDDRAHGLARADEADALAAWIATVVDPLPAGDERHQIELRALVACAERFVADVAAKSSALDHAAAARLGLAIGELRMLGDFRCSIGQALRFIRERVQTLSVGADRARPGHLHVSALRECGLAGRRQLYVVGLEEGRVFPATFEDPILLDAERARILPALRRSADVVDEAVHAALSRLAVATRTPGVSLTASYSCRDLREFRETYASWVLLHLYREATSDPAKSYQDLRAHLGPAFSCVPVDAAQSLGPGRWWLQGITRAGAAAGQVAVKRQFAALAAGMAADEARRSDRFTEFDGCVPEAGPILDPCSPSIVVSPTQLEQAAECPFRHFLRRGLKVEAIESGDRDRDVWLDPLIRGSLLHDLYASLLRRCREAKRQPSLALDRAWLQKTGQDTLGDLERDMPPPSLEVREREAPDFLADLDLFLEGEIEIAAARTPVALEVAFGRAGGDDPEPLSMATPVTMTLGSLTIRVAGRVDRIDELADGSFEILDYKTGGYWPDKWKGTFAGGRRLQHALYGLAAVELLKQQQASPRISGAQYYFSSTKGRQERKIIPVPAPAIVGNVLSDLREVITAGLFIHAPDTDDCRFCNYGPACGPNAAARAEGKLADPVLAPYRRLADHE
jgi:ATP-dependent helicase/nuclease subunit B